MTCTDQTVNVMLKTYGVSIVDGKALGASEEYMDFYDAALTDIEKGIKQ